MISLWIRNWCVDLYIAEPGYDGFEGYDTYLNLGVGITYIWGW